MFISLYITILINIIFFIFFDRIQKKINIYDKPNTKLKIHTKSISSAGGILLTVCLLIYFLLIIIGKDQNFFTFKENFSLMIFILSIFLVGIYDDKYNLQPYTRLILTAFLILILLLLNESFIIKELRFSFLDYRLPTKNFSILFTIICTLLFVNACNMFDGINLQFGLYVLFLSIIFISKQILPNLQLIIVIFCFCFLYFNLKKKLFMGNNGTVVSGALFSILFIKFYNLENDLLYADEIFLFMSIPGFDLIRVSFARLSKGLNMFSGDKNHIHHLLFSKYKLKYTIIIIQTLIIFPVIYSFLTQKYLNAIIISFCFYILVILYAKRT